MDFWGKKINVTEEAARRQVAIINTFSAEKRFKIALDFANMGIDQTHRWIKEQHPEFSDLEVRIEFVRLMYYETGRMEEEHWQHFKKIMGERIKKEWTQRFRKMMEANNWNYEDVARFGRFKNGKVVEAANGSIQYVWAFGAIALFVLIIACINFMNLTTARSSHRAKEIGVRKVLGSMRSSLIGQFLSETLVMTAIAVLLALGMVTLALPWFTELAAREMSMPWGNPAFWLSILVGTVLVGLLAGSYPAFFLSAFNPLAVLQGHGKRKAGGAGLRSALVIFQFTTSIVLIIATILVFRQLNYIQNKKLGFQKDQTIIVENAYALGNQVRSYKQEMLQEPEILAATISSYLPVPSSYSNTSFTTSRELRQDNAINMGIWTVDHDYQKTIGFEMAEGRFFDMNFPTDSSGIILNERAIEILGFEEPLGKKLYLPGDFNGGQMRPEDFQEFTIIGVTKDFHWQSLRENIGPLSMRLGRSSGLISFKLEAEKSSDAIAKLESTWKAMAPAEPFSYRFMDESFASMYEAEQKIGTIATSFSLR